MVAAAVAAAAVGQVLDGGLLIVIFATSGALEAVAAHRTAQAVRGLLDLAPDQAVRIDGSGAEEVVEAASLEMGDVVLVRPGERIGADGQVLDGASEVDQATITGEPLPVVKMAGDEVFAGTLNGPGALRVRVGRAASDTVVARIVAMVAEASATKARTQLFIEKVEQRYSAGMVAATVLLLAVPLLAGAAFQPALLRAMTFMIVASPCAVVLATMPPLLASIANAGRHRVLVKSAVVIEQAGFTTRVAFDKTGTLTEGTPRLAEIQVLPGAGLDRDEVLALAAAAENPSEHPLSRAVAAAAAREAGLPVAEAREFTAVPGRGVTARVAGRLVEIGSPAHLLGAATAHPAGAAVAGLEETGQTAAVVRVDGNPVALLGIADRTAPPPPRPSRASSRSPAPPRSCSPATTPAPRCGWPPGRHPRRARRPAAAGQGRRYHPVASRGPPGPAGRRRDKRRPCAGRRAHRRRDGPRRLRSRPGHRQRRHHARRPGHHPRHHHAVPPGPPGHYREPDHRRRDHRGAGRLGPRGHLPLPLGVAGHEGSTVIVGLNGLRLLRGSAWRKALNEGQTL